MTHPKRPYLGTQAQQSLLARGAGMHLLTADDPRYTYYGRTVGLVEPEPDGIARFEALARLQGYTNYGRVPGPRVAAVRGALEAAGLSVAQYARWIGETGSLESARAIVAETPLPDDLELVAIAPDTEPATLQAFSGMALSCGVLPPALTVMAGWSRPGLCLVARDAEGRVVSCAGAAAFFSPSHPDSETECWWGMLATDPARRGARLSLLLGARVMIDMHDRYGFSRFMTGIEPGNAPSEAVCTRMGMADMGDAILGAADASLLPGGRMTK